MSIIEEVEKRYGIKVSEIQKTNTGCGFPIGNNEDLKIINSHNFKISETGDYDNNFYITIRCTICSIEADIINNTMHCFYNIESTDHKYASCSKITMEKACF